VDNVNLGEEGDKKVEYVNAVEVNVYDLCDEDTIPEVWVKLLQCIPGEQAKEVITIVMVGGVAEKLARELQGKLLSNTKDKE